MYCLIFATLSNEDGTFGSGKFVCVLTLYGEHADSQTEQIVLSKSAGITAFTHSVFSVLHLQNLLTTSLLSHLLP